MPTQSGSGNMLVDRITADSGDVAGRMVVRVEGQGVAPAASSTSVTPASDSAPFPVVGNVAAGQPDVGNPVKGGGRVSITLASVAEGTRNDLLLDSRGQLRVVFQTTLGTPVDTGTQAILSYPPGVASGAGNPLSSLTYNWNGTNVIPSRGDSSGAWTHSPPSTPTDASGTIAASGSTVALTFTNTTQGELINPSTATLWARWGGVPAVNGAGSFPIAPGGSFSKDRVAGTLNVLSTAANQPYTFTRYS